MAKSDTQFQAQQETTDEEIPLRILYVGLPNTERQKDFVSAEAKIDGATVIVSSLDVDQPVAVRYAFTNTAQASFFNAAGLPASSFRTDDQLVTNGNQSVCNGNVNVIEQSGSEPIPLQPKTISYLVAERARRSASIGKFPPQSVYHCKRFWLKDWTSPDEFIAWRVKAPAAGRYEITILAEADQGTEIKVQNAQESITFRFPADGWQREIMGTMQFAAGADTLRLELTGEAKVAIKSLELIHVDARAGFQQRISDFRADTTWLAQNGYGVMFQAGQWCYPPKGDKKIWPGFARDFNVKRFVDMVEETGAGFVVWSATWMTYYFPAPIKTIDAILPGRTSKRDLIMDLADELNKRGIKLILYYHVGHGNLPNTDWWDRNWNPNWEAEKYDKSLFFKNWINIITEVGQRYGDKLAAWMFDGDCVIYPADYEALGRAAKAGYPERIISYNPWIACRFTEFQDFAFGEEAVGKTKRTLVKGKFLDGPLKGLQSFGCIMLDGPNWGVHQSDLKILPPYYSDNRAAAIARHAAQTYQPIAFNLLMYENGDVSLRSMQAMRWVRQVVREGAALDLVYPEPPLPEMSPQEKEEIFARVRAAGKGSDHSSGPPPETKKPSAAVAQWLSRYGHSIQDTQAGPLAATDHYVTTCRNNLVYVHVLDWQGKNNLLLPPFSGRLKKARILGDSKDRMDYVAIGWTRQTEHGILLVVPEDLQQQPHTIMELEIEEEEKVDASESIEMSAPDKEMIRNLVREAGKVAPPDGDSRSRATTLPDPAGQSEAVRRLRLPSL